MIRSLNVLTLHSRRRGGLFPAVRGCAFAMNSGTTKAEVLSIEEQVPHDNLPSWWPLAHQVLRTMWPHSLGYARSIRACLEQHDPDLIHTHGLWRYASGAVHRFCRERQKPYLISPHGMLDWWALRQARWKKKPFALLYENNHLRHASCLRALCPAEAQGIREFGLRNPVCVIPNGVEMPAQLATLPPPWQGCIGPTVHVLLYLGRLHPKKGLAPLLRAWAALKHSPRSGSARWALALVGVDEGGHAQALKTLATQLGLGWTELSSPSRRDPPSRPLPAPVLFLGPLYDAAKHSAYSYASAFVLPSLSEGLPLVVLEAWAMGLPVLMTPECHLSEGFSLGAALPVGTDVPSIVFGLQTLFSMSEAQRREMGQKGRDLCQSRFSWGRCAAQLQQVYEWLLGLGPRPDCVRTD